MNQIHTLMLLAIPSWLVAVGCGSDDDESGFNACHYRCAATSPAVQGCISAEDMGDQECRTLAESNCTDSLGDYVFTEGCRCDMATEGGGSDVCADPAWW